MYEAFDKYLATDTWHTSHPMDDKRFYLALHTVVTNPDFNPDTMGEYFHQKKPQKDPLGAFEQAIADRVHDAWAVRDYLEALAS